MDHEHQPTRGKVPCKGKGRPHRKGLPAATDLSAEPRSSLHVSKTRPPSAENSLLEFDPSETLHIPEYSGETCTPAPKIQVPAK